jgi:uncharacterized protein
MNMVVARHTAERNAMPPFPSDVAFTPAVKGIQDRKGSRRSDARMERGDGWQTTVNPGSGRVPRRPRHVLRGHRDRQPYIHGGPPGFLKVVDDPTLGFADFGGNRQYATLGNLPGPP